MSTKPRTLADFRAAHDVNVIVPSKIKTALAAMEKIGPEHYEYESDFMKMAGVSQVHIAKFRDQFASHIVETAHVNGRQPKRVYFATAKAAAKARDS